MRSSLNIHVCTSFIPSLGTYKKITTLISFFSVVLSPSFPHPTSLYHPFPPSPFLPSPSLFLSQSIPGTSLVPRPRPAFPRSHVGTRLPRDRIMKLLNPLPSPKNSLDWRSQFLHPFSSNRSSPFSYNPFPLLSSPPPPPFPPLLLLFMIPRTKLRQMTPPTHLLEDFSGAVSCPNECLVVVERQLLC